ncbi:MAG: TonB-dependent receptor [Bacteroidales bacterium]
MKRFFIICLMILTYHTSNAQNKITGKITDNITGEAIPGATVYIPELKTGAIADKNGIYKIDNLPRVKVIIQVSFLGYKAVVENVDLATTSSKDFVMEQAITEINEVVVTGSSRATEISRTPVPMIIVNSRDLQQNLNTNIIDAISRLPGVSAVTTGPNVSKPFIHGLGYNRVLTLFDGVRQEGQQWGDEHGIEIDENAVDRIEIVKGPASLIYGSDALAGVVNLLPAQPVPDGTIKGHAETNYQTNNGLFGAHIAIAGNHNGFIWGGVASHKQATNYQNRYDGRVYGTAFNETDLSGNIGLTKQWGYSHLNFSIFNDLQEIPDGSRDSVTRKFTKQITEADTFRPIVSNAELNSYKITVLHQLIQHYRIYSSNNFILGEGKLGLILGYQQSIRREFSHPQYPDIPGLYLDLKTITYDAKYSFPESNGWEATIGVNGMYQRNTNKGTEFVIPDYSQFDIGPFVMGTKTLGKLDLSAGARYDTRIFRNDAMYTRPNPQTGFDMQVSLPDTALADHPFYSFNHTFSGVSASLGATYKITKRLLVKANIARGFRAPNIAEISANGVHPGTLIYQIGNTGFKPEFSLQEDLGISYISDHISGNLDMFNNNITNYIFNQKLLNHSGKDSIIIKGNQTFKFQQAKAQLYGWEANLDIHPYDWLHFENSISVTYALNKGGNGVHVTDSSRYLPLIPPLHTNTELRANIFKKFKYFTSVYVKIGMEYYATQNRVYSADNTETPTPGYVLYNAGVGADITNSHGKVLVSINITGNNITDVAYQSNLSRLKYFEEYPNNPTGRSGIYNMGRNISFKFTVPLNR